MADQQTKVAGLPAHVGPSLQAAVAGKPRRWLLQQAKLNPADQAKGFTAYGVTEDDPISQAMKGLAEGAPRMSNCNCCGQAVEKLSAQLKADCVPCESERGGHFEKDKIDQILGK